ncbi:MAG: c-type cytochrome [Gammaproteobacteria bacterium]|nr:c-type cytochrome [Gammaproteobacteria bacterium]
MFNRAVGLLVQPSAQWRKVAKLPAATMTTMILYPCIMALLPADARGNSGFPNLSDSDWIWGDTPDNIKTSITNGRMAAMPAWGPMLGDDGVRNTAAYVLSLSGREVDAEQAAAGKEKFDMICAACHGADGTGNPMLGAPNLANGVWLYGGDPEQVMSSIHDGRKGVMPAHAEMLGEDKIHIITAYVYSLN